MSPFFTTIDQIEERNFSGADELFFVQALKNTQFCMGATHPNPPVGAVLVKDGLVIANGYTHPAGDIHAEKHALLSASLKSSQSSLYVTLEPCSHFGRTPPCTKSIIDAGVKRVIFGVTDPNPLVFGHGIRQLTDAGLKVLPINHPTLATMSDLFITPFRCWITHKRPYVVLKIATSLDNKVANLPKAKTKITGPQADIVVHQLRRAVDAVLIGGNTARIDNPSLTSRLGHAFHNKQPTRVILSTTLKLDENLRIFDGNEAPTILMTTEQNISSQAYHLTKNGIEMVSCPLKDGRLSLELALKKLGSLGFTSVLIESGQALFNNMVAEHLADEIWWFRSKTKLFGPGLEVLVEKALEKSNYQSIAHRVLADDEVLIYKNSKA